MSITGRGECSGRLACYLIWNAHQAMSGGARLRRALLSVHWRSGLDGVSLHPVQESFQSRTVNPLSVCCESHPDNKKAALAGGFKGNTLANYLRRRSNKAAAPNNPSAIVEGSGITIPVIPNSGGAVVGGTADGFPNPLNPPPSWSCQIGVVPTALPAANAAA